MMASATTLETAMPTNVSSRMRRSSRFAPSGAQVVANVGCSDRCVPECDRELVDLVDDVASGIEASNSGSLMRVDDYVADLITFRTQVDSQFRAYGAAHRGVDGVEDA